MIEIILPVLAPISAAVISVGGGMLGARISRAAELRRRVEREQKAMGDSVLLLQQGLNAVVGKLEEIRVEWQKDRREFHIWQQQVEGRLSQVEVASGVVRVRPPFAPYPQCEVDGEKDPRG